MRWMRSVRPVVSLILLCLFPSTIFASEIQVQQESTQQLPTDQLPGTTKQPRPGINEEGLLVPIERNVAPGTATTVDYGDARIEIGPGAAGEPMTLSFHELSGSQIAPMNSGMDNTTQGPRAAYRFLPHGTQFEQNITLRLPYDPTKIPAGLTEQDIRTYYFDDQLGVWVQLEFVEVDTANRQVVSLTDHFTDFINGTLVVPEQPGPVSFTPTSISDIQVADPGEGINLIQEPELNNRGDLNLGYPIQVPPGRNGLDPDLAVTYSSGGGNGWMGIGWDIGISSVSIDTRWGVPRYDAVNETETYVVDGKQLSPIAHRSDIAVARTADKVFHERIEGAFERIVRHGDSPSNYWWEITDKSGVRRFYGGTPESGTVAANAVLADGAGNVFQWLLVEVRDLSGNSIRYTYDAVSDPGVVGGANPGINRYPNTIEYAVRDGVADRYVIEFVRDRELPNFQRRKDASIDARGGFKLVTADLLKQINVKYNDEMIRSYQMIYEEGPFEKSLLTAIEQYGDDGTLFHTHEFEYFDEARQAAPSGGLAYRGFDGPQAWNTQTDNVQIGLIPIPLLGSNANASALSGASATSIGGSVYIGFNPFQPGKDLSGGVSLGYTRSDANQALGLFDVNGDNLPDKVFNDGGTFAYRPNQSGPSGNVNFGSKSMLPTLPGLSEESSNAFSVGPELYFVVTAGFAATFNWTSNPVYIADANADGLPDFVSNGSVSFNALNATGVPTFDADSNATPVPISSGSVDAAGLLDEQFLIELREEAIDQSPLTDMVRRWVAPYGGVVDITGDVTVSAASSDGVRVAIQQNGAELWSTTVAAGDASPKTPTGVTGIPVVRGDRIYFRTQSVLQGSDDVVTWTPRIEYQGQAGVTTDVNLRDPYVFDAAQDFVFAGRPGINAGMPFTGTVRMQGQLTKSAITSDDAVVEILRDGIVIMSQTIAWDQTGTYPMSGDFAVVAQEKIQARVRVDSPVDATAFSWNPELFYLEAPDAGVVQDDQGNYIIRTAIPYDVNLYPNTDMTSPQTAWVVPEDGTYEFKPQIGAGFFTSTNVVFTVKKRAELLAKRSIDIVLGEAPADSFELQLTKDDEIFLTYSTTDGNNAASLNEKTVNITRGGGFDETLAVATYAFDPRPEDDDDPSLSDMLFPQSFRGWDYFAYNGNRGFASIAIDENRLVLETSELTVPPPPNPGPDDRTDPTTEQGFDTTNAGAWPLYPDPVAGRWRGGDDFSWIEQTQSKPARLSREDVPDVPNLADFAGGRAVTKTSFDTGQSISLGVSVVGGSVSFGQHRGNIDYFDMNGDSFPDIVGDGRIHYTTMTGGLEPNNTAVPFMTGNVREGDSIGFTVGVGGNPTIYKSKGDGTTDSKNKKGPTLNGRGTLKANLGISGGYGTSTQADDIIDMNGDSLPDLVRVDGGNLKVRLNLGYAFAAQEENWGAAPISEGESATIALAAGGGFNKGSFDWAGGITVDRTDSRANTTLADMNGDGLLDVVWASGDRLQFRQNTGTGFSSQVIDFPTGIQAGFGLTNPGAAVSVARTATLGAGAYFTIGIGPVCLVACYIIINPGLDLSDSRARQEIAVVDMDGDGFVDHVKSQNDNEMTVARSVIGKTNLLREVRRPLGGSMTFDYQRDGNTYDHPSSVWLLNRVEVNDGQPGDGEDVLLTTVRYEGGLEDRLEREFYGYARVIEEQRDRGNGEALYRQIIREYRNDSFYVQGLLTRESVEDAFGNKYVETENTWTLRQVAPSVIEPVATSDLLATVASPETVVFPMLLRTDQRFYMGEAVAPKSTFTTLTYDELGNVVEFFDAVDVGSADDQAVTIGYEDACAANYVVGVPNSIVVRDTNGNVLRRREADIDCASGKMTQLRQYLTSTDFIVTDVAYQPDGNVSSVTGPPNANGQRYRVDYGYDTSLSTYLTSIVDSFGLSSTASHDLKYGSIQTTIDANGNATTFVYDAYGRATSVTGPYEQGSGQTTIRFEYHPEAAPAYAVTEHFDPFRDPNDPITTVLFADGLGRVVQAKKDGTVHTGVGAATEDVMIVSGAAFFDFVGRVTSMYFPLTEPLGTPGVYNGGVDGIAPAQFTYDLIDRTTQIQMPSGLVQQSRFGFGLDRDGILRFETEVIDTEGNSSHVYRDVTDLVTAVKEYLDGQEVWASHGYNAMAELVSVTDDLGNVVSTEYDAIGRRTAIQHPDTGRTEVVYDDASNVITQITENLRGQGQQIQLTYDFNRLTGIIYPQFAENSVTYFYGEPGAPFNRAGRVTTVTDQSGSEERFYGLLGEITKEIKTFASDTQGNGPNSAEVYTTQYTYDSWGRLHDLVYPDGELLEYEYDSGGLVRSATGFKGGWTYEYLRNLEYDKFGERKYMELGNGVESTFAYDPARRRLTNVVTGLDLANPFQNVSLQYDSVGNVLQMRNDVPVPAANMFGGPTVQNFQYDTLYRMTSSDGEHRYSPNKRRRYSLEMTYDTINNIQSKTQLDEIVNGNGNKGLVQRGTSYAWTYDYQRAHTPSTIGDRMFQYDGNGNQLGWDNTNNGTRRSVVWDENNNVRSIFDNGHEKTFKYDYSGRRVMKRGPQGETAYINQYFTVRNREIVTKHFFVGVQRIASKLMKKAPTGGTSRPPFEKDSYFFHPDHVGSSRFITDADGAIFQHLEYFPFGEIWIEESTNRQRTPYLFAGNELDEETGLTYFGGRYYEPRTSLWISADPVMDQYLDGYHLGGVYNWRNLSVYGYAYQNPLKYTDINGNVVDSAWDAFEIGLGVADAIDNAQQGSFFSAALGASGVSVDAFDTGTGIVKGQAPSYKDYKKAVEDRRKAIAEKKKELAAQAAAAKSNDNGGSESATDTGRARSATVGSNGRDGEGSGTANNRLSLRGDQSSIRETTGDAGRSDGGVAPRDLTIKLTGGTAAEVRGIFDRVVGDTPLSDFDVPGGARATLPDGREITLLPTSTNVDGNGLGSIQIKNPDTGKTTTMNFEG